MKRSFRAVCSDSNGLTERTGSVPFSSVFEQLVRDWC